MNSRILVVAGFVVALAALATTATPHPLDCPDGNCPLPIVYPVPVPIPVPVPRRPINPAPWGERKAPVGVLSVAATVGGPVHADGTEIQLDLPEGLHQKNTGGSDGAGLCVFASLRHSGRWADEPVFAGLFDWMRNHPGGSYPEKTDQMIVKFCAEKGLPKPDYVQVQDADLGVLKAACAAGLMPGVTTMHHSHMISLVSADDKWFVTLDNNLPGKYKWQTPEEFKSSYTGGQGKGWAVIPLKPGPPPVPANAPPTPGPRSRGVTLAAPAYEWRVWSDRSAAALMLDGRQVGNWDAIRGVYRSLGQGDVWGPREIWPPLDPPAGLVNAPGVAGGIDASFFSSEDEYRLNGRVVARADVTRAIGAAIPDHGSKLRMVVIGPKAQTDPVVADFTAASNPWSPLLIVQAYAPDHWHVAPGFVKAGAPSITVETGTGEVVWRQSDYAGGAKALGDELDATPIGKLRRPRPDYDPAKDPSPLNRLQPFGGGAADGTPLLLLAAGVGGLVYLRNRK